MAGLYPEQKPYESGRLDVGDGHLLAYNRYGNPAGDPAVYLHGGPGAGTSWEYRMFDPERYNILLFDQRGCGASTPYGEVENNSIAHLVADIEKFRLLMKVESWSITGGSWGAALGMFYKAKYPARVSRALLRGICFADTKCAQHIIEADGSAAQNRNTLFDEYEAFIPADERRAGLMLPYHKRLMTGSADDVLEAARLFDRWDTSIATFEPNSTWLNDINANPKNSVALAKLFFHFSVNHFRMAHRMHLLQSMSQSDVPVAIIHGRQDNICPVENAVALHRACRNATLKIVENCGHVMSEPGLQEAFIAITDGWPRLSSRPTPKAKASRAVKAKPAP